MDRNSKIWCLVWFLIGTFAGWLLLTFGAAAGITLVTLGSYVIIVALPVLFVVGGVYLVYRIFWKPDRK